MKRNKGHAKKGGTTLGFAIITSILVYALSSLIAALILGATKNPLGGIGIASVASFFFAAFISGIIISKRKGEGGILLTSVASLFFVLVLFVCCAVITKGRIPISSAASYLAYVVISVLGGAVAKKCGGRRRFRS